MSIFLRHILAPLCLLLIMLISPAFAQSEGIFADWAQIADRAEASIEANTASNPALEALRDNLSEQRAAALEMQQAGIAASTALSLQLSNLGPEPEDEPAEIARLRADLAAQVGAANVPVFEAQIAHQRADDLITRVDALIRLRINKQLITLGPTPLNPAIWSGAVDQVLGYVGLISKEVSRVFDNPVARQQLLERAPFLSFLILGGLALLFIALPMVNRRLLGEIERTNKQKSRFGWAFLLSIARFALPALAATALIKAIILSEIGFYHGASLVKELPFIALTLVASYWLKNALSGSRWSPRDTFISPKSGAKHGQKAVMALGIILALRIVLDVISEQTKLSAEHAAVLNFPLILVGSYFLFRASKLLKLASIESASEESNEVGDGFNRTIIPILRRLVLFVAVVAPLLAAIGYFAAARFFLYPTIVSLGLIGATYVAFGILTEAAENWLGTAHENEQGANLRLLPIIIGFLLATGILPVLALIWGARDSDLSEIWIWLNNGVSLGDARISLTDVVNFAIVFTIGYAATRLTKKMFRNSILPRTRMDAGGRNATLSGIGYVGFTLAGLVAISATGLDLSSLAIVAGALSVGVGFGLQTIVSNFVSGIILLIERPIKEGDWVEVGEYSGYVRRIAVRSTEIENFDRGMVIIPNSDLIAGTVLNWTHSNLVGRVKVPIGVAYGSDPREVERILKEVAMDHPMTLRNPGPSVVFHGFGADSMDFEIRAFLRDVNYSLSSKSDMNYEIVKRFEEAGIEIPFAQRDIHLKNIDEVAKAFGGKG